MSNDTTSVSTPNESYASFTAALLAGKRSDCQAIFESWLADDTDLRVIYQQRLQPALYEIGELWEQGRISVATEHLASAIVEGLLNLVYPRLFERTRNGKSAVVACTASEYHQIGGKIVADLFALNGWRADFLGADASVSYLLAMIRDKQPDVVVLSLAIAFNLEFLMQTAVAVRKAFPEIPILVGGQAFRWVGRERIEQIENVHYLATLDELVAWMESRSSA